MAEDEVPRAKRLKLLREAKARKERQLRGEEPAEVEEEAGPATASPSEKADERKDEQQQLNVPEVSALRIEEESRVVEKEGTQTKDTDEDDDEEEEELTLAPKRANWDIERDIAPMLKKLEKRTQQAIVEILREKMAAEQQEEDDDEEDDDEEDEEDNEAEA